MRRGISCLELVQLDHSKALSHRINNYLVIELNSVKGQWGSAGTVTVLLRGLFGLADLLFLTERS